METNAYAQRSGSYTINAYKQNSMQKNKKVKQNASKNPLHGAIACIYATVIIIIYIFFSV